MNTEQIYKSHIDVGCEYKMDKKISRVKWIIASIPMFVLIALVYIGYTIYLETVLGKDTQYYMIFGFMVSVIFLFILVYNFQFANPTKKLSDELQLFVWQEYYLRKIKKYKKLPRSKWSLKYLDYLATRMEISERLHKLDQYMSNSFVFYGNYMVEKERYKNYRKAVHHFDITRIDDELFKNKTRLFEIVNEIFACVYTEKVAGINEENNAIRESILEKKNKLNMEFNDSVNNILKIEKPEVDKMDWIRKIINTQTLSVVIIILVAIMILIFRNVDDQVLIGQLSLYIGAISLGITGVTIARSSRT